MNTRILVIFTGGTIGSRISDGCISVDDAGKYNIIEIYRKLSGCGNAIEFDTAEPYSILSENLNGDCMRLLGETVGRIPGIRSRASGTGTGRECPYGGIIITHGSDTLQYSAAMLDLYLPCPDIPVMLVASNLVPDDPEANGPANFKAAVDYIAGKGTPGVFVPYRSRDGITYIHRGSRMLPHVPYSDDCHSMYERYFGTMSDDGIFMPRDTSSDSTDCSIWDPADTSSAPSGSDIPDLSDTFSASASSSNWDPAGTSSAPSGSDIQDLSDTSSAPSGSGDLIPAGVLHLPTGAESGILRVHPCPGMSYPSLSEDSLPRAILLDTYHCGTVNCHTDNARIFFEQACALKVPVYLTGAYGGPRYASTSVYDELHIRVLPPMSPVCAYMYLWMSL